MIWLTWALVGKALTAWLLSALAWFVVSLVRRLPENYHDCCALWGLCFWWPLTVPLEILLTVSGWRARRARAKLKRASDSRAERQASP